MTTNKYYPFKDKDELEAMIEVLDSARPSNRLERKRVKMKIEEIKENLCKFDRRHPGYYRVAEGSKMSSENATCGADSKSVDKYCLCGNCTSGKTKLAVAMLEMASCTNCLNSTFRQCYYECKAGLEWEEFKDNCDKWELNQ